MYETSKQVLRSIISTDEVKRISNWHLCFTRRKQEKSLSSWVRWRLILFVNHNILNDYRLSRTKRHDHITPVSASLHRLPVCFRTDFKMTFKAPHDLAPDYSLDLLIPYEPLCSLRSSGRGLLSLPETRMKTKGERVFAIRAPRIWNDLPEDIRLPAYFTGFCF